MYDRLQVGDILYLSVGHQIKEVLYILISFAPVAQSCFYIDGLKYSCYLTDCISSSQFSAILEKLTSIFCAQNMKV